MPEENIPTPSLPSDQDNHITVSDDQATYVSSLDQLNQTAPKKPRFNFRSPLILIPFILILFTATVSAAYFGYYLNPKVIWSESLANTAEGYNALINYASKQNQTSYKGFNLTGALNIHTASNNYSGSLNSTVSGVSSISQIKANLGAGTVTILVKTVKVSNSQEPDTYININGLNSLGLGIVSGGSNIASKLDGQWIQINHSLLQSLISQVKQNSTEPPNFYSLSSTDLINSFVALGKINNKYIFTTNKNNSVTYVSKYLGFQTINGIRTYHYRVGFNKNNLKNYLKAVRNSLSGSSFGSWLSANTKISINNLLNYNQLQTDVNKLNNADTVDVWMNVNSRIVYKVRIYPQSNSNSQYIDVGINKVVDNQYPFFLDFVSNTKKLDLTLNYNSTLNTTTNKIDINFGLKTNTSTVNGSLGYTPTNNNINIQPPSSSETLQVLMNQLGLGQYYNELIQYLNSQPNISTKSTTNLLQSI